MIEEMGENPFSEIPVAIEHEDEREKDVAELRVKSNTSQKRLAGSICGTFKEHGYVKLRCIGAGAIAKGFKAFVISRGYLVWNDFDVVCTGAFFTVVMRNGNECPGVVINIEHREKNKKGN